MNYENIEQYIDIDNRISLILEGLTTLHNGYKLSLGQEALVMEAKGIMRELSIEIARGYISALKHEVAGQKTRQRLDDNTDNG